MFEPDRNLVLSAGAGAGKTHALITLALQLLGGARLKGPLHPAQLVLVTFTDKAAAELRTRLRQRLERLMAPGALGQQSELLDAFRAAGVPEPPASHWRQVRDDLGTASIGTFHSLCAQLLRRAPAGTGVDPSFDLLDEHKASSLLADVAEREILQAIEADEAAVVELCQELGFSPRRRTTGLVGEVCRIVGQVREEGIDPRSLAIDDPRALRSAFEAKVIEVRQAADQTLASGPSQANQSPVAICREALQGLTIENFLDRLPALDQQADQLTLKGVRGPILDSLKALKSGLTGEKGPRLKELYGAFRVAPHERAFRDLLWRVIQRHKEELKRRQKMDFTELLVASRDLLRDHPLVRGEVQHRIGALLVDEFQDTNRIQLELVGLLSEERSGGPRAVPPSTGAVHELPLEPGLLCVVGDRKQSIYQFRGADVSIFNLLARRVESEGGKRVFLQQNRRSSGALLSFFNALFAQVLLASDPPKPYEVGYRPAEDDLRPHRTFKAPCPSVERITFDPPDRSEDARRIEAEAIAKRLGALLSASSPPLVEGSQGEPRAASGSDVAILFRRFTFLEVYRQALLRWGIPHRVVRGRGFYGAQEVMDLAALCSILADPDDSLSLAAVLRSPLVGLPDAELLRLSDRGGGRLGFREVERMAVERDPGQAHEVRLRRFVEVFRRLRSERDRLGIGATLEIAVRETGYRVALATWPDGAQAIANVEKLIELGLAWDRDRDGDLSAFARQVKNLADADPAEAQADLVDVGDPDAVLLLTIHQAKGLEWPIVFVPELSAPRKRTTHRILFDRHLGLSIRPWIPDEPSIHHSPKGARISGEIDRRDEAEYRRLLYVALTRAKDHLVLSGQTKRSGGTWWQLVDQAIGASSELRALVEDVPVAGLDAQTHRFQGGGIAPPALEIERAIQRVRVPKRPIPANLVLPVTALHDYLSCPRRYRYKHRIGLPERATGRGLSDNHEVVDEAAFDGQLSERDKGTLAHWLLEKVDFALAGSFPSMIETRLSRLLGERGVAPADPGASEVIGWVTAFLQTPFARALSLAGNGKVHRELPFLLKLSIDGETAVHLRGQIDLLYENEAGGATVIDYKASRKSQQAVGLYQFQLDCYAAAARRLVKHGVPVRTGIAFLKEASPEPELGLSASDDEQLSRIVAKASVELAGRAPLLEWPGRPVEVCDDIGCGYRYRCHPPGL